MKNYLISALLWLFFVPSTNGQSYSIATKHFRLVDAWMQKWSPGTVEKTASSGGGKILFIKLFVAARKSDQIDIVQILVDGKLTPVELVVGGDRNFKGRLKRGEEVLAIARVQNDDPRQSLDPALERIIANKKSTAGWLCYEMRGKKYLLTIPAFEEREAASQNQ